MCIETSWSAYCEFDDIAFLGYTCQLVDAVTTEPGQELEIDTSGHAGSRGNSDVTAIITVNTTSLTFYPQNLLTVFPNVYYLLLERSGLTELAPITNCENVHIIHMVHSHITEIPAGTFAECVNLQILDMSDNEIATIDDDAFVNLAELLELNLGINRITRISTPLFRDLVKLQDFYMHQNLIEEIEDNAFVNLHDLIIFYLQENRLAEFNPLMFGGEIDLVYFNLAGNLLTSVPRLPLIAPRIRIISLDRNRIERISDGDFTFSYSNVTDIELNQNLLTELDSTPFEVLERLDILSVNYNRIRAVDNELFDRVPSLYTFYMERNECADVHFDNIRSRDQFNTIYRLLDHCFYEFIQPQQEVVCNYVNREDFGYSCELDNLQFLTFQDKFSLSGNHLGSNSDSDVQAIVISSGNMFRVPPTIFRTYENLETVVASNVGLTEIDQNTFIECGRITHLDVSSNRLRRLPSTAFRNCEFVERLNLDNNQITAIRPCDSFLLNIYLLRTISLRGNICVNREINHTYQDSFIYYIDQIFDPFVRQCYGLWYTLDEVIAN